jgi:chromosome segregation ATPase
MAQSSLSTRQSLEATVAARDSELAAIKEKTRSFVLEQKKMREEAARLIQEKEGRIKELSARAADAGALEEAREKAAALERELGSCKDLVRRQSGEAEQAAAAAKKQGEEIESLRKGLAEAPSEADAGLAVELSEARKEISRLKEAPAQLSADLSALSQTLVATKTQHAAALSEAQKEIARLKQAPVAAAPVDPAPPSKAEAQLSADLSALSETLVETKMQHAAALAEAQKKAKAAEEVPALKASRAVSETRLAAHPTPYPPPPPPPLSCSRH